MASVSSIAIVDDDAFIRSSTASLLRSAGFVVSTFGSVAGFLAGPVEGFDCVISDIQMPEQSGLDLQRALSQRRPGLPIIFSTAFPDKRLERHVLDAGAGGFLEKPCDPNALIVCLQQVLTLSRASDKPAPP